MPTLLGHALRKKFKTPADALKALGLDPSLLAMDSKMDEIAVRQLMEFLADKLSEEDLLSVQEMLAPNDSNGAADEPPPFPGRPRPGGGMDPLSTPVRQAMDAALHRKYSKRDEANKSAIARFPGAARIRVM